MLIERKHTADLIPADYNPRKDLKPGDPEYDKLKRSMEQFGYVEPVIWNKATGRVVGGHQRLKVLMDMGVTEVECVVVELDEDREKALNIALNKISGDWDEEKLMLLISDLQGADFDVSLTGFDPAEIDDLFKDSLKDGVKEDDFDVDAELENPAITKAGDVWTLGRHRLVCGDSTKPETFALLMDGLKANLVITDPPYNVNYESADGKKIRNDDMDGSLFREFLEKAFQCAADACQPGAAAYIFHADTEGENFRAAFREAGWELHGCLIWVKNSFVLGHGDYQYQHEPCLYGWKPGAAHYFVNDRSQSTVIDDEHPPDPDKLKKDELVALAKQLLAERRHTPSTVIRCDKPARNAEHPTMKPVPLCGQMIRNSSLPGQLVLDLFGGSGSTLIAAEQLSRQCFMMECDPAYVDVIVDRWEQLTGEKAEKI